MATVEVILRGRPTGTLHYTDNYPVVLLFDTDKSYQSAVWVIPSYPGYIPAGLLSEIRVPEGPLDVAVDGPEGFQSGPHHVDWVRSEYPRGKFCSLLEMNAETQTMGGVSIEVVEGSLIVDKVSVGGAPA